MHVSQLIRLNVITAMAGSGKRFYISQGDIRTSAKVRFQIFSKYVLQCKLQTRRVLDHSASVSILIRAGVKQGPLLSFMKNSN